MLTVNQIHNLYTTFFSESGNITQDHLHVLKEWFPEIIARASLSGRELTILDSPQIASIFRRTYGSEDAMIAHHLGLDTWETEGDKAKAVRIIVEAYKQGSISLFLENLALTTLPEAIGSLTNLKALFISRNRLTALPEAIGRLTDLTWLAISRNHLTALPEAIGRLTNLRELDISRNHLTGLPRQINNLIRLVLLNISNNRLTALPEAIGSLTNLTELDISRNLLTALPEAIGSLTNLTGLYISNNRLTGLPRQINNLIRLRSLNYSDNLIQNEPEVTLNLIIHIFINNPFCQEEIQDLPPDPTPNDFITHLTRLAGNEPQLEQLSNLGTDEINSSLHLWLFGLVHADDFANKGQSVKAQFAKRVLEVLQYAALHPDYKRNVFDVILADQTCADRATLALDNLELFKEIEEAGGISQENALNVLTKAYVVEILDGIARQKMSVLPNADEIEVYLAYRVNVGRLLDRDLGSRGMRYSAPLNEADYNDALRQVQGALRDTKRMAESFVNRLPWRKFLDENYAEEKAEALRGKRQALERLERREKRMPEGEYLAGSSRITNEAAADETAWYLRKTEELLNENPSRITGRKRTRE